MKLPRANSKLRFRETVRGDLQGGTAVPPYGFLEGFLVKVIPARMSPQVVPNMDAAAPYRLSVELLDAYGKRVPLKVQMVARPVVGNRKEFEELWPHESNQGEKPIL